MKYTIFCRYQYRCSKNVNPDCVEWTTWFRNGFGDLTDTDVELKEELKNLKEIAKDVDKRTKLKHEYKIDLFDETTIPEYKEYII